MGNAYELLAKLMEAWKQTCPQGEFREAYSGPGSRLPQKLTVCAQVAEEAREGEGWTARLDLRCFFPSGTAWGQGEELLAALEEEARKGFPGFSGARRGEAVTDQETGLLAVPLSLFFSGGQGGAGALALLGGQERAVSGWSVAVSQQGEPLVSIGESQPFAILGAGLTYTVTLEGLDTTGLERMTGFTAVLGEPPETFAGCRWKSLSAAEHRGVFVSRRRLDEEG